MMKSRELARSMNIKKFISIQREVEKPRVGQIYEYKDIHFDPEGGQRAESWRDLLKREDF